MAGSALLALAFAALAAPAHATIRYDVDLARPAQHTFHVTMTIPDVTNSVLVQIPAWNGLYQIRDFGYHITDLRASDDAGHADRVTRLDKDTWRIETGAEKEAVRVIYDSYWDEPGPFGTQLNMDHAFLNLAMLLCYVPDRRAEESVVHFADLPQRWRVAIELPMSAAKTDTVPAYTAASYDALVDAPAELGEFDDFSFTAGGRRIRVVFHTDTAPRSQIDKAQLQQSLTQIVDYESQLMGGAPFQEYMFLYHVGRDYSGGGMEHANCTAISMPEADELLNVSAHEFFHAWNVKRIRPQSLEPVDYTREMWTPSLWFAEGVTNTYAAYTLVRTGLWNTGQFLQDLGAQITELETRPAHLWESAEESSLNAWLEKYPLYDMPDFSVSYYNKGQLIGVLLDIAIRDATDNRASLDDVMRRLNTEYARQGRFYADNAGIRAAAEEVVRDANAGRTPGAPLDLADFFSRYVSGTDEIPFADLLRRAGLELQTRGQQRASLGFALSRKTAGALAVTGLDPASSAAQAGLREDDVIESFVAGGSISNPTPLAQRGDTLERWVRDQEPGEMVRLRVRRAPAELEVTFALGVGSSVVYGVEPMPNPGEKQARILNGLLQGVTATAATRP